MAEERRTSRMCVHAMATTYARAGSRPLDQLVSTHAQYPGQGNAVMGDVN